MPLIFPPNPTIGDTYTDDNSVVWQFDGVKWNVVTGTVKKIFNGVKVNLTDTYTLSQTESIVNWDSASFDTGSYWNVSNPGRLVISETGYYNLLALFFTSTTGAGYTVKIKLNGTIDLSTGTLNANQSSEYNEVLQFNAGDYLEIYASEVESTGGFTTSTYVELTQLGLGVGVGVNASSAFSGVKTALTSAFNTTSTLTAIAWNETTFDVNANAQALTYWSISTPGRITIKSNGYFQIQAYVLFGSTGSNYTLTLRKNGTTVLNTSTNRNANDQAWLEQTYQLETNDYLELLVSSGTNGTVTSDTYLQVIRTGF